jgi:hypothetical protein
MVENIILNATLGVETWSTQASSAERAGCFIEILDMQERI